MAKKPAAKKPTPKRKSALKKRPVRETKAPADVVAANAKQLFSLWLTGPSRADFDDNLNDNKEYLGKFASIDFDDVRKGSKVLAKLLLDHAKGIMPKHANFMLDEYLDGYLSDAEYKEFVEE